MKPLFAFLLLALPTGVLAESDIVSDDFCQLAFDRVSLGTGRMVSAENVRSAGTACEIAGIVVDMPGDYEPDFHIDALTLEGRGLEGLMSDDVLVEAVYIDLDGLRIIPPSPDPFFAYMMRVQQMRNGIDVDLAVLWDQATNELRLEQLDVDFPGENALSVRLLAKNVDLSSHAAMDMSVTSMAVTELDVEVTTNGLFEAYLFPMLGNLFLGSAVDPEQELEMLKAQATALIGSLPDATFDGSARDALAALVADLPNPGGTVAVSMRAEPGFGSVRLMPLILHGYPRSVEDVAPMIDGVTVDVTYDRVPIE